MIARFAMWAIVAGVLLVGQTGQTFGAIYNIDVLYSGNGVASLVAGSDDPQGLVLNVGDTFNWTITAEPGGYWEVETGHHHSRLMAIQVLEDGDRTIDFDIKLRLNGVLWQREKTTNQTNSVNHFGPNSIYLWSGIQFNQIEFTSVLTSASALGAGGPVSTTLTGLLPFYGAPENNILSPGVIYFDVADVLPPAAPTPEPATAALGLLAMGGLAMASRRRRVA